jgi:uncharacterized protein YejL (UPF0352 family)
MSSNSSGVILNPSVDSYTNIYPDITGIIVPKNSLLKEIKINKITQCIVSELQKIPELNKHRLDLELICMSLNLVENLVVKKDKIDKKQIIIQVFAKLFLLNPIEQNQLCDHIEFLLDNNKVKKIKKLTKYYKHSIDFLKKKLF